MLRKNAEYQNIRNNGILEYWVGEFLFFLPLFPHSIIPIFSLFCRSSISQIFSSARICVLEASGREKSDKKLALSFGPNASEKD